MWFQGLDVASWGVVNILMAARDTILKRGIDPVQTVASENARRPVPRQSGRKRQNPK